MQFVIEEIRKIVVLVLLMEIILQLQCGKQYEPYIKMLAGIIVIYSLVQGIFGFWNSLQINIGGLFSNFTWSSGWEEAAWDMNEAEKETEVIESSVIELSEIRINTHIETITIEEIELGGVP